MLTATPDDPVTGWRFDMIGGFGVITQVAWGVLIAKSLRQKSKDARIMLVAYIIFMVCLIHDSLTISNIIFSNVFWNNLGYPAIITRLRRNPFAAGRGPFKTARRPPPPRWNRRT